MRRLATLIALLLLVFTATAQAIVPTTEQSLQIAYHYWGGWCDGSTPERTVQVTEDPTLGDQTPRLGGQATGVVLFDDGRFEFTACAISVFPDQDPALRCRVVVHEVGHLSNHRHEEGGIMAAVMDPDAPFAPCDPTPREKAIQDVRYLLPEHLPWTIHCTRPLARCRATSPDARYPRRFQVEDGEVSRIA